jgi:hypothetical protein
MKNLTVTVYFVVAVLLVAAGQGYGVIEYKD